MKKSKLISIIAIALALSACNTNTPVHTDEIATTDATTAADTEAMSEETTVTEVTEVTTEAPSTTVEILESNIVGDVLHFHPETKRIHDPDGKTTYYDVADALIKHENIHYRERITKFAFGDVVLDVYFEEDDIVDARCFMTSIGAFGHTVEFDEAINIAGAHGFDFYVFDGVSAAVWSQNGWSLKHWFFTEDGIIEIPQELKDGADKENHYDDMVYELSKRDDGRIGYKRTAFKYHGSWGHSAGWFLGYCVALDEFYCEKGCISIDNGEIVFNSEKTVNISEALSYGREDFEGAVSFSEEYEGTEYIRRTFEHIKELGWTDDATLEEYIAENAKLYPRVY